MIFLFGWWRLLRLLFRSHCSFNLWIWSPFYVTGKSITFFWWVEIYLFFRQVSWRIANFYVNLPVISYPQLPIIPIFFPIILVINRHTCKACLVRPGILIIWFNRCQPLRMNINSKAKFLVIIVVNRVEIFEEKVSDKESSFLRIHILFNMATNSNRTGWYFLSCCFNSIIRLS